MKINECTEIDFEAAGIKINTNNSQLSVIGVYRSPSGNYETFFSKFETLLTKSTKNNSKLIFIGDFNIDVLDVGNPITKRLADLLRSFGLKWFVNTPTRVTAYSQTAIDNIISNLPDLEVNVVNTAVSDHYGQQAIIRGCQPTRYPLIKRTIRETTPTNLALLDNSLSTESWDFLNLSDSFEQQFNSFELTLNFHLNMSCPVKIFKSNQKRNSCTWITKGILVSREKLKLFSEISKSTTNPNFKDFFLNYKKTYRKVIKAAKAYDVSKILLTSKNLSKTAWSIIKNKDSQNDKPIQLDVGSELVCNAMRVAYEFNSFFSSAGTDQGSRPSSQAPSSMRRTPTASLALAPVSEQEIAKVINDLAGKKSNDVNHLSMWLIKKCSKHISKPLAHLINLSFSTGIFPSSLKIAKVKPIFKKGDPFSIQNYRPISVLPTISKIFEKLYLTRVVSFLDKYNLLSNNQFGFRKGKSTIDAVVCLVEKIVEGLESRKATLSVFLDLSKAFDCVDHTILLQKLHDHGIRGVPLLWLESYLSGRSQFVQISDARSGFMGLRCGVPQGSILSPLLFLIYVNGIDSSLQHGSLVQYADDTTLCFTENTNNELERRAFLELNSCIQHFQGLNLKANAAKSSCIKFCLRPSNSKGGPTVMIDETEIEEVNSTKFLGIHLDQGLTWNSHINSLCNKLSSAIYLIRNLAKFCSSQILMTAYYGLIYPHLSYGVALWGGCSKTHFIRVFKLQKKAVRIVANLQCRESCKPVFKDLNLLTLPSLYILEAATHCMYKTVLTRGSDIHAHDTRGRDNYRTGQHRTVVHEQLPSQMGINIVNRLPGFIKSAPTPKAFKSRLKHILTRQAFYSIDEFLAHNWEASELANQHRS